MKSNELFNGLNGCQNVDRSEIIDIIELAKQENNTDVIYRLSKILNSNPNADDFNFEIIQFPETGLNGSRHTGDYREALDECGRLKKGFRFENGKVVKVAPKVKPIKKSAAKTPRVKKIASNYGKKSKRETVKLDKLQDFEIKIITDALNKKFGLQSSIENSFKTNHKNGLKTAIILLSKYTGMSETFLHKHIEEIISLPIVEETPAVEKTASNKENFLKLVSDEKSKTLEKIKERKAKKETPAVKKSAENEYPFSKDDIPYQTGYNAHRGTSFSPEKRAEQEQNEYFSHLKNIYDKGLEIASKNNRVQEFKTNFERYQNGYKKRYLALLHTRSGLVSTMIAGGSNFPVARMRKISNSVDKKLNDLVNYMKYSEKVIKSSKNPLEVNNIKTGSSTALDQLKEKLKKEQEAHELTLIFNKIMRKKVSNDEKNKLLLASGFTQKTIDQLEKSGYYSLPQYVSANRNARMKELKRRIQIEENLKSKSSDENVLKEVSFDGGRIEFDYDINKIKIHFDNIPSVEIRNFIKKSGQAFKWSPFNKVWQRQLNTYWSGSRKDLYNFLGVKTDEKKTVPNQDNQLKLLGAKKQKPALKSAVQENSNVNKNSLAYRLQNKGNVKHEYYIIPDKEISNFLGQIEKKNKESVAITIAGGQGSMKTRLCFQLMNAFAQNYKVGHASIEEHPESKLYEDKIHQYLNNKALNNIVAPEIENINDVHKLCRENDVIVIDSFSKLQEMQKGCELDKDFRKAYDGKLFIIIYQLTGDGKMRGGSKSQFDGDIISFVKKEDNYKDNYCYHDKNRYNNANLEDLKFNIFSGKINQTEAQKQEVQPKETIQFSFNAK